MWKKSVFWIVYYPWFFEEQVLWKEVPYYPGVQMHDQEETRRIGYTRRYCEKTITVACQQRYLGQKPVKLPMFGLPVCAGLEQYSQVALLLLGSKQLYSSVGDWINEELVEKLCADF